ncbi:hypothetical protein FOVSG1_013534 [Fusarium oxysporum f. sp. vasinfectum]
MRTSKILAWLDTLQLPFPSTDLARDERAEPSAKRVKLSKEASSSRLPTPPYDMPPSPKKRSRTSQDVDDDKDDDGSVFSQNAADQTTPRAIQFRDRLKQHQDTYPPGSPSGTSSELSRPSSISNASSPTKQQRNAALQETGYKAFSFTLHEDWQPESLKQLKSDLEKINGGEKLIPVELKTQLPNVSDFTFFDEDHAPKTPPYRYPDPDFVSDILERAALCLSENEGESSWNFSVHGPILSWVFPSRSRSNLLHFRYCPAATIVHGFKPKNAPAQMVDFCIIARPQDESPEQIIIEDMCQYRPDKTINHTDWGNLNKDPIAISIETKKHGEGWSSCTRLVAVAKDAVKLASSNILCGNRILND